jgi:hypothetical protein
VTAVTDDRSSLGVFQKGSAVMTSRREVGLEGGLIRDDS